MGTYIKGILGPFSGKIGTVIGSSWNGIEYMKSLPKPSSKKPSDKQMIQRGKLGLCTGFLKPISFLVNLGFKNVAKGQTGFNTATSLMIERAITGEYPDLAIDYSKVLISSGNLSIPSDVKATSTEAGKISFIWANNSTSGLASETDKAILLVHSPEKSLYQSLTDGASRDSGGQILPVPDFVGQEVHIWMAFISADGKTLSGSVYVNSLTVTDL